jgi:lathosterol oxidase
MNLLIDFILTFSVIALVLMGIYFIGGYILSTKINPKFAKIQPVECKPELIKRDIKYSVSSLLLISVMTAFGVTLNLHGYALFPRLSLPFYLDIAAFFLSMFLFDTLFYWAHRLVHWRPLFRPIHALHHSTRTPTVWSTNSDTLLDNVFLQSYWMLAALLLPIPIAVILIHKIYDQIFGLIGHSGHEYATPMSAKSKVIAGVTHHDQHHQHCNYNYAVHFQCWDRWMGTLHKDYDSVVRAKAAEGANKK